LSFNYIGYYSLIFALGVSLIIIYFCYKNFLNIEIKFISKINSLKFVQLFLIFLSFFSLTLLFVKSDFSNQTVYDNSHTTIPLFYKISGTWGNHEGSLLLWLLVLSLFLFIFMINSRKESKNYFLITIIIQQFIICGFLIFLLITSNPFNIIFPVPKEGLGLNPILQDPALAIHPPILYLGFVGTSIIFSSSLAALSTNQLDENWASQIKKWVLTSWFFLTVGIVLGSIWAYYELGWGGFWFWDPVENISLLPWISLTALIHCILVLEKRKSLVFWTVTLSITTFLLSLSGTFLVRSGILNSVHTFANDPERGIFILSFLFLLIFFSLTLLFFKIPNISKKNLKVDFYSKEIFILINNLFMIYFLSVVIVGTIYPIFLEVITSKKISVGPPFFNKLIIPFLIPFLIIMGIGPKLSWIKTKFDKSKLLLVLFFIISLLISYLFIKIINLEGLYISVLLISSIFLILTTLKDLVSNKILIPQKISHFGFSLLIISILLNSILSSEVSTNLKVGEKFNFQNGVINFKSLEKRSESNFDTLIGIFEVVDKKNNITQLNPELRIYNQPNITTSEADIDISLFKDKFIVMNFINNQEYFSVRYQTKPFMIWIWISAFLIALGGIIGLIKKTYEKY
tara:strand:- start:3530 stop:5416 length:1887 start_codon:yes stop_codon:yes gene_type:complete